MDHTGWVRIFQENQRFFGHAKTEIIRKSKAHPKAQRSGHFSFVIFHFSVVIPRWQLGGKWQPWKWGSFLASLLWLWPSGRAERFASKVGSSSRQECFGSWCLVWFRGSSLVFWTKETIHEVTRTKHETHYHRNRLLRQSCRRICIGTDVRGLCAREMLGYR